MMQDFSETQSVILTLVQELTEAQTKEAKKESLKSLALQPTDSFSSEALEIIADFLRDPAPSVRLRAARLLGHCQSHIHVNALIELTNDENDEVAYAASLALGEIGESRAALPLAVVVARFKTNLQKAQGKREHQKLIEPRVYPDDPMRTILTFRMRSELGHDKSQVRMDRLIADARTRFEAVQDALDKCSGKTTGCIEQMAIRYDMPINESLKGQDSLKTEYTVPWSEAYGKVCFVFADFDDKQKCDKCVRIRCAGCGRIFSFSQLMDVGAMTIFHGFVALSSHPVDSSMMDLAKKDPTSWRCPDCNAEDLTFEWLGEYTEDLIRFQQRISGQTQADLD